MFLIKYRVKIKGYLTFDFHSSVNLIKKIIPLKNLYSTSGQVLMETS